MIIDSSLACIIADDLTGANDSALQFHLHGTDTQIILGDEVGEPNVVDAQTWAISTETRNINPTEAYEKIKYFTQAMIDKLNPDYFFKKIDSTVRGNIAPEVLGILEILNWDAAVIIPAFPAEGRVTVGGYHLLKGVPIERTEMARDPFSPINESHLPTLLNKQVGDENKSIVGALELKDVMKGAGPILQRLNELIEGGKKLIIADAVSTTDIEQIVLAINKSEHKILPAGTSATARVLSNYWFSDLKPKVMSSEIPDLPKLVISGSATDITESQICAFENSEYYENNSLIVTLELEDILSGVSDLLVDRISSNLTGNNVVVVHTSSIVRNFDGFSDTSLNAELTKDKLAFMITDFLSELTRKVLSKKEVILILLGGETSYRCCKAIGASQLRLIDEVAPAIALSLDYNSRWIVTKSGNLGGTNTLIDILRYFDKND